MLFAWPMQVEKLGLGWCKVGAEEGARSLADLLMFNTSLRSVDLRGNELGDAGASQICRALKEHGNEGLLELDLGYNEIKDDGACFLAQVSFFYGDHLPWNPRNLLKCPGIPAKHVLELCSGQTFCLVF